VKLFCSHIPARQIPKSLCGTSHRHNDDDRGSNEVNLSNQFDILGAVHPPRQTNQHAESASQLKILKIPFSVKIAALHECGGLSQSSRVSSIQSAPHRNSLPLGGAFSSARRLRENSLRFRWHFLMRSRIQRESFMATELHDVSSPAKF